MGGHKIWEYKETKQTAYKHLPKNQLGALVLLTEVPVHCTFFLIPFLVHGTYVVCCHPCYKLISQLIIFLIKQYSSE